MVCLSFCRSLSDDGECYYWKGDATNEAAMLNELGSCTVLQITLSPEILQKADWSPRQMIDCYLSRSTLKDSVAQDIRRRCATLFRLYFQQTNQAELQRQAVSLASAVEPVFHSGLGSAGREHQHTETAGICTENDPYAVESVDFTVRDGSTAVCVGKLYLACSKSMWGPHLSSIWLICGCPMRSTTSKAQTR